MAPGYRARLIGRDPLSDSALIELENPPTRPAVRDIAGGSPEGRHRLQGEPPRGSHRGGG